MNASWEFQSMRLGADGSFIASVAYINKSGRYLDRINTLS